MASKYFEGKEDMRVTRSVSPVQQHTGVRLRKLDFVRFGEFFK